MASGHRRALLLVAVAVFALLRLWSIDFGDPPNRFQSDERHYPIKAHQMQAWDDIGGGDDPQRRIHERQFFENPMLFTHVLFGARVAGCWMGHEMDRGDVILLARALAALMGAATALIIGATARRLTGSSLAGTAACVVAGFSFLHGRDSHYGVNDVPVTFLMACAFLFGTRALTDGQRRWFVWSAVLGGLAAAMKYNGSLVAGLPMAALVLRGWDDRVKGGWDATWGWGRRLAVCTGLGAFSVVVFVCAAPMTVIRFTEFWEGFQSQLTGWGDRVNWGQERGPGWLLYGKAGIGLVGWIHLAACMAGLVHLLRHLPREAVFTLAFPVAYLSGMLSKDLFYWRFAIPLLPFIAVFAGAWWCRVARKLARMGGIADRPWIVLTALLAIATAEPAAKLVRHNILLERSHTWDQARDWIVENVDSGDHLFLEGYFPSRFPPRFKRIHRPQAHIDKLHTIREGPPGAKRQVVEEGGWLVTDTYYQHGWAMDPERADDWAGFHERLAAAFGPPAAEFAPGPAGDPMPFIHDQVYSPLNDLWAIERPGHTVRVWRIPPDTWGQLMVSGR